MGQSKSLYSEPFKTYIIILSLKNIKAFLYARYCAGFSQCLKYKDIRRLRRQRMLWEHVALTLALQVSEMSSSDKRKHKRWLEIILLKEGKPSRKKYLWRARDERDKGMVRKLKKSSLEEYQAFRISEHIFSWALNVCQALLLICPLDFEHNTMRKYYCLHVAAEEVEELRAWVTPVVILLEVIQSILKTRKIPLTAREAG